MMSDKPKNLHIGHLGPSGTYAEAAAINYTKFLVEMAEVEASLCSYASIAKTLHALEQKETDVAVVPVENSIEGSVTVTMDMLWQLDDLQINLALVMPICHTLVSGANSLDKIEKVYSHPQALAQCQKWLNTFLPKAQLVPTNSTTEALGRLNGELTAATISSKRAAQIYNLPILASSINDSPENCTRFWVVSRTDMSSIHSHSCVNTTHTSLAFSLPANIPGALVKPLQVFSQLDINLSRIESRPTKRSLGEYLFFIDLEADATQSKIKLALSEFSKHTEVLKIFGSYSVLPISELSC